MKKKKAAAKERGCVIWLTGISGSGKTTLGRKLYQYMLRRGHYDLEFLDGDVVRSFFADKLGYSRQERMNNIKRIVFASKLLAKHGVVAIVANIAPYFEIRDFIREHIDRYHQIYISTDISNVKKNDVKGLYKKHAKGKVGNVIGIDDVYEPPRSPDLTVYSHDESVGESFNKILAYLKTKGILSR